MKIQRFIKLTFFNTGFYRSNSLRKLNLAFLCLGIEKPFQLKDVYFMLKKG